VAWATADHVITAVSAEELRQAAVSVVVAGGAVMLSAWADFDAGVPATCQLVAPELVIESSVSDDAMAPQRAPRTAKQRDGCNLVPLRTWSD